LDKKTDKTDTHTNNNLRNILAGTDAIDHNIFYNCSHQSNKTKNKSGAG